MWFYNKKEVRSIEDMPENAYGFIYEITHIPSGKKYIGKKVLYFERNVKLGKKELQALSEERKEQGKRGKTPTKKLIVKESDWQDYFGSHEGFKELVKQGKPEDFYREILQYVFSKKLLTYYENFYLFSKKVLEGGNSYVNDNIESRYFRKDFL